MLGLFTRLCLGVVLLLAFWLVAVLFFAGLFGLWMILSVPVGAFLLFAGRWLVMVCLETVEPDHDGLVSGVFWTAAFLGVVVGAIASITAGLFGAALYHEAHGSTTSAPGTISDGWRRLPGTRRPRGT